MEESQDYTPLSNLHKKLIEMVSQAMDEGRSPLVLDNMNLSAWECKECVQAAINHGYSVEFVDIGTGGLSPEQLAERNRHDVDVKTIRNMIAKYDSEGPLTVDKVLKSELPEQHIA